MSESTVAIPVSRLEKGDVILLDGRKVVVTYVYKKSFDNKTEIQYVESVATGIEKQDVTNGSLMTVVSLSE